MGSVLAYLTAIIVAALTAALAVPHFIEWKEYRDVFETQATRVFGRPVKIEGDIDLKILPTPFIKMRDIRIADERGSFQRPFAEADRFDMYLSLPSLLSGTVEARRIEIDQPVVRLTVDELGEGSWQSVGPHGYNLPIREFVLNEIEINNGIMEFRRGQSSRPSRIDSISGTFVADGLTGPFRFTGTSAIAGDKRDVRLATGNITANGFHLKGAVRSNNGGSIYHLDGNVSGLEGALKYSGPIVVRLALDRAAREAAANTSTAIDIMPGKVVELRASSDITLENMKLENIAFTLTQNERPQSLTGSAFASWTDKPRLDIAVDASWLDVDQLLRMSNSDNAGEKGDKLEGATPPTTTPIMAIAALPQVFNGWPFAPQEGSIKATFQQASLGGEMVEGLNFEASHGENGWKVDKLIAKLPGDTNISVKGTLQADEKLALSGNFEVSGKNLSRLLRWAAPSLGAVDAGNAPRFSLNSGVTLSSNKIIFENAKGQLGDSSFSGDLNYDFGDNSQLQLSLISEKLDLRNVFDDRVGKAPPPIEGGSWVAKTENAPPAKASLADVAASVFKARSTQVSVRIAQLQLPSLEAHDVRSAFRYEGGSLDIDELNLASTDGLMVKASGRITDVERKPNGAIKLDINAPTPQSVANLVRLGGGDSVNNAVARRRVDALAPLKLSGKLSANRQSRELHLSMAGSAAGSELDISGRFDGDFADLSDAKLNVTGSITNTDGRRLIAQLAPEVPMDETAAAAAGPGTLRVTASGAFKDRLTTGLELTSPYASGRFDGRIVPLADPWTFEGNLSLDASQASTALSILRISPGGTPVTGALALRAGVSKRANTYEISDLDMQIGGETVSGSVKVDVAGAQPVADLNIEAGSVMLPKLAAYLVDWDRKDITSQVIEATGGATPWANQAFSFRAFEGVAGTLRLKAAQLALADEVTLSGAKLDANIKDGALSVTALDGRIYNGTFSGSGTLKSERGRLVLDARMALANVDLAKHVTMSDGKPVLKGGKGDLELTLQGEGLSPRGLIAVTSGKGELRLQHGMIYSLSPRALRDASDTYLSEEIPQKDKLTQRVMADLRKGTTSFSPLTLQLAVKDGVLHAQPTLIEGQDYVAKVGGMVDLASFRLDSEWELSYTGKTKSGGKLPALRIVFAGPLASIGKMSPQVNLDQYELYLSTRRREMEEERLRRLGQRTGQGTGQGTGTVRNRPQSLAQPSSEQTGATQSGPGWSTGTETVVTPTESESDSQDGDFEARIRKTLEEGNRARGSRDSGASGAPTMGGM